MNSEFLKLLRKNDEIDLTVTGRKIGRTAGGTSASKSSAVARFVRASLVN